MVPIKNRFPRSLLNPSKFGVQEAVGLRIRGFRLGSMAASALEGGPPTSGIGVRV